MSNETQKESIGSVSLIRQGEHTFYSLTMETDILAQTCFVVSRNEDPKEGFQRLLDEKRASEIAAYIDNGLGTIPSSIILSAQDDANFQYNSKTKTVSFNILPTSFLIIDGQHRVYGFSKAKKALRVPVIIYSGLSKRDETRLFIDINSKQKGVPPELLLDIKKLAEYESDQEEFLGNIFDLFHDDPQSVLYGSLSPSSKARGMLTRNIFYTGLKPLIKLFGQKDSNEIYKIVNNYFYAFNKEILEKHELENLKFNSTFFKVMCNFFPIIAVKVKDAFGPIYTVEHFSHYLKIIGQNVKTSKLRPNGTAFKPTVSYLEDLLTEEFTL